MHSTPNYGYTCNAPGQSDRDIERLKDKADNHGERITRNEERIKCLSGRVHSLECAPCGKEAPDCKPDSCGKALRRHLTDPDAHEELFDQKVDKKDGCRLICEDELQGIYGALDERYTQAEVDVLLAEKVNIGRPARHSLELCEGISTRGYDSYCYKNAFDEVTVVANLRRIDHEPLTNLQELFVLPEELRPKELLELPAVYHNAWSGAYIWIRPDGSVCTRCEDREHLYVALNVSFLARP